ncbi:MAG TPA: 30S ribosomal protein S6 [Phaeodactylibacter sp.]|nr:30S ribosomal protein S6 [Phaeodactylibacter sp.]
MLQYEVTFIVDPVLSGGEIKATAQSYEEVIKKAGGEIVHVDEMGLRELAYPIKKRSSGIYYCIEFTTPSGKMIYPMELTFRRDERILRFLTVKLDKYGIKYNADKRAGLIGKVRKKTNDKVESNKDRKAAAVAKVASAPKPTKVKAAKPAPVLASNEEE